MPCAQRFACSNSTSLSYPGNLARDGTVRRELRKFLLFRSFFRVSCQVFCSIFGSMSIKNSEMGGSGSRREAVEAAGRQ